MDSNLKVYLELFQYDQVLKKTGSSLRKHDKGKYLKLLNCLVKLSDHIHYQQKMDYLILMENFVNLKIDGKQFVNQFLKIHRNNEHIVKILKTDIHQLENLQLNSKSFGFTEWISEIALGCDEFYPDFKPQDQEGFVFARDEENFRAFIANLIPNVQRYCEN